jgi:hypothetical protein
MSPFGMRFPATASVTQTVRPDEHAAAERGHHLALGAELVDRVDLGIAALVAEPRRVGQRLAANDGPDVTTIAIDCCLAHGSHRPRVGKLRPAVDHAVRVGKRLGENDLCIAQGHEGQGPG